MTVRTGHHSDFDPARRGGYCSFRLRLDLGLLMRLSILSRRGAYLPVPARPPDQDGSDVQQGALAFGRRFQRDHIITRTMKSSLVVGGLVVLEPNVPALHFGQSARPASPLPSRYNLPDGDLRLKV